MTAYLFYLAEVLLSRTFLRFSVAFDTRFCRPLHRFRASCYQERFSEYSVFGFAVGGVSRDSLTIIPPAVPIVNTFFRFFSGKFFPALFLISRIKTSPGLTGLPSGPGWLGLNMLPKQTGNIREGLQCPFENAVQIEIGRAHV